MIYSLLFSGTNVYPSQNNKELFCRLGFTPPRIFFEKSRLRTQVRRDHGQSPDEPFVGELA